MTIKNKTAFFLLLILTIGWITFIFGNSLKNAESSDDQSGGIVNFVIEKILQTPMEKQSVEFVDSVTHYVRKVAHFTEFAILGLLCFLTIYFTDKDRFKSFLLSVCCGFSVAVCDELLQLTSEGRACRFSDVCIDTSGVLFACCMMILMFAVLKKLKKS